MSEQSRKSLSFCRMASQDLVKEWPPFDVRKK
jgi:hypothetical protein